ncbi:hypothetical protein [Olleya marilimosa]|uniref:hypothetical protein n=1 Tax=Olleya marilimosa TaxID=272164 RepID=UPI00168CD735|nr:hypothetical protein [Olleya marilimosa]MBD3890503.1 hypothetical protein [Olleya marilimosa]
MTYTYSICHPDKPKIEYPKNSLSDTEVIKLITNYPWLEILTQMKSLKQNQIYYSPSLDFKSTTSKQSLCITASLENDVPEFSLWYNRPIKYRPLFGLLSEKTKVEVIDKWGFSLEDALKAYQLFLNKNYNILEQLMAKK